MSKKEAAAIYMFLTDLKHARSIHQKLMERAGKEPERVRLYLDTLTVEAINNDPLLRKLKKVADSSVKEIK